MTLTEETERPATGHAIRFGIGVAIAILVYALLGGFELRQRIVAAVFAGTVVLWITEALPLAVTALLSTTALVASGGMNSKDAFGAYGDQIILLFVGSFIIAKSMEESGLDKRISYWLLSQKWATASASSLLFALGLIACVISLFVSNTATTAMLVPIGLTLLTAIGVAHKGHPVSTSVLLMLTWGSSIAVGTIIGTPPNVIGVGLIREATGVSINFVQWSLFAMPVTIVMFLVAWLLLRIWRSNELPDTRSAHGVAQRELAALGPLRDSEIATMAAFFLALILWLLPGIVEYSVGMGSPVAKAWSERIPEAVAALIGATVLFLYPCRDRAGRSAMNWGQATRIEWGTILLFAGGLALGKATFDSGLAKHVGEILVQSTGARDVWTITAISTIMAIALSELASNTASATTVVPVAIAMAEGAGVSPIPAALGATIGANLGFMLPISTAPNAIVYSTGLIPPKVMMRSGIIFDAIGFVVTLACLRLILPLLGLDRP
jgi:sodium-dependent dicarboxylate transporter 2/3/5